jgi:hypothetical protein
VPSLPHGGDSRTSIEQQLQLVADLPPGMLRAELESVWRDCALPPAVQQVIADGSGGPRRVADALWAYWDAALGRGGASCRPSSTRTWPTGRGSWPAAASPT